MRITCPGCAATYEVPASRLSSDKKLRCASCGTQWRASDRLEQDALSGDTSAAGGYPSADLPLLQPAGLDRASPLMAPQPMAPQRKPAGAAVRGSTTALRAAWVVSVLVLLGAIGATLHWRNAVMDAWPPSKRLLAALDDAPTASQSAVKPGPAK